MQNFYAAHGERVRLRKLGHGRQLSASVVLLSAEENATVYRPVSDRMKVVEISGNLYNEATSTKRI